MRLASLKERFWVLPTVFAVVAGLLAEGLSRVDSHLFGNETAVFLFAGGPEGARALLSAIVSSMISFTALVFSITIVVLQLTSGQFSPRVLRTFLRDRFNQVVLGVFVATFVYAMVVLRSVRGTAQVSPFVPQLAVTTAFGFILASTIVFLVYLNHTAQAIRVATIIGEIAAECRGAIERCHPADADDPPPDRPSGPATVVGSAGPGVIVRVDTDALAAAAARGGCQVELLRTVGEFVPEGGPLFRVRGGEPDAARLCREVHLAEERTPDDDPGFGLRQLVDIALRALSPGVNDPTTAVQVLDQVHDLLRRLATRQLAGWSGFDRDGRCVLLVPVPRFDEYLDLAVTEVGRWGGEDERIRARVVGMLRDVHAAARPEHRDVLARCLHSWQGVPAPSGASDPDPSDVGLRAVAAGRAPAVSPG